MKTKIQCSLNEGIVRLLLIIFNFIFAILSIALIALGSVFLEEVWWPEGFADLNFVRLPVLLIILGALSFIASIAGCYFAKSNNKKHLIVFIVCMVILLALELTVALISFTNMDTTMQNNTRSIIRNEFVANKSSTIVKFHALESYYDCCGVDGVMDYLNILHTQFCCQDVCGWDLVETTDVGTKPGCVSGVLDKIEDVSLQAGCFTLVFAIIQVLELASLYYITMQYE